MRATTKGLSRLHFWGKRERKIRVQDTSPIGVPWRKEKKKGPGMPFITQTSFRGECASLSRVAT